MKSLDIKYMDIKEGRDLEEISREIDSAETHSIDTVNWESFPYKPDADFKIIYSDYGLYIKFIVKGKGVLARKQNLNDQVFKESCVEFFVSPGDGNYHNFEFNAIGTMLAGVQRGRGEGYQKDEKVVGCVRTLPSLGKNPIHLEKETKWSLLVEIPFKTFTDKTGGDLKGESLRANFYKCGDETKTPHYVTWNNIDTENPDFHRPEFFGVINFK